MRNCILLLVFLGLSSTLKGQFVLNGDAVDLGGECYRLTDDILWQGGSVFHPTLINLDRPFSIRVSLNLGFNESGADGIAFLLQPISTALGAAGGGIGYEGVNPSFAVEFDTYQNGSLSDPVGDHLSIQRDGILGHLTSAALTPPVDILPTGSNAEDGAFHSVLFSWDPSVDSFIVEVDCSVRAAYSGNIKSTIFSGNPYVYIGFTGSTGGHSNNQQVCFEFLEVGEGPDTAAICVGDDVVLDGPNGFSAYNWSPATGLSDPSIANPVATPLVTTLYTLTFSDDCGNDYIDSFVVQVDPGPPPAIDLGADTVICAGTSLMLNAPAGLTYLWSNGSTSSTITATAGGTYWVDVSTGICSNSDTISIGEATLALNAGADAAACTGDSAFIGVSPLPGWTYTWSNGVTGSQQWVNAGGTYTLTGDSAGCSVSDEVVFTLDVPPVVQLPDSVGWCPDTYFSLDALGTAASWLWSTGEIGNELGQVNAPGLYWVDGFLGTCSASDSVYIYEQLYCDCKPIFPNAFTPNGDGLNDYFGGMNLEVCPLTGPYTLEVYNRWGDRIFSAAEISKMWDGTFRGEPAELGAYTWVATYEILGLGSVQKRGSITLMR